MAVQREKQRLEFVSANYYDANRIEHEFLRGKRRSKASSRILRVETTCDVVQM